MEPETNSLLTFDGYVLEIPEDLPDAPEGTGEVTGADADVLVSEDE